MTSLHERFEENRRQIRLFERCVLWSIVVIVVMTVLSFIGCGVSLYYLSDEISERGLKGVIEQVWHGEGGMSE